MMKIATILLIAVIATTLAAIQIVSTIGDFNTAEAHSHGHGHGDRHGHGNSNHEHQHPNG